MASVNKKAITQAKKQQKKSQTFIIDCAKPVNDKIMDIAAYRKYLHDKIKINHKTGAQAAPTSCLTRGSTSPAQISKQVACAHAGQLTDDLIKVSNDKTRVTVTAEIPMSKRCESSETLERGWAAVTGVAKRDLRLPCAGISNT